MANFSGQPKDNLSTSDGESALSLRHLAIRGTIWSFGGYGTAQILRLVSNIILARLLFPEAFGLMALVSVFMQGLNMFSDIGIKPSIIQSSRGDDPVFLNTAWTIQVIRGVALWFIACLGSYPFALFYGEPLLRWLIPIAGLTAVFAGFQSTSLATANRQIQLGKITLLEIYSQVVSMVIMITIAWIHKTVWALVAGGLSAALVKLALSHLWIAGIRNRFCWDRSAANSLLMFGKWIFVSTLLTFCVLQADRLIFGQLVPAGVLGVYSIALALASIPREVVMRLGGMVVFPAYSRKYQETGSLRSIFFRVRSPLVAAGGILSAFMLLSAPALIGILYDERYTEAGWILRFLSIGVFFHILECTNGSALLAMGKPKLIAFGNGMKLLGMLLLIPTGYAGWGFPGAVAGFALSEGFRYIFSAVAISLNALRVITYDLMLMALWGVTVALGLALFQLEVIIVPEIVWIPIYGILVAVMWSPVLIRALCRSRGVK